MSYKVLEENNIKYISFDRLREIPYIKHGFSTKIGGVSTGSYQQMNMGFKTGDKPENVIQNLRLFCDALKMNFEDLVISHQIHSDEIMVVKDKGRGYMNNPLRGIDALITNEVRIPLMTYYADCVPLFIVDPVEKAVGLAHAGWPGTVKKIGYKTIKKMIEIYGTKPEDIIVVVGPSIGECCYEVGEEVIEKFNRNFTNCQSFVIPKGGGKYTLNLWEANRLSLKEIGVLDRNIIISGLCTGCNPSLLYSHRMEGPETGRMAAVIQLLY
ncbi:peptidoglycan editing factor PgeF [Alkaliphilus serpentinus]|uniref:Purine nucleoside phosphorylase n=1 Tax=Alkaliphilus serpentinus TaxID=1482731 RepID=A0A833MAS7_9FIRM|nr:peptidoglycan editing factor PgeF [Alkaliphilus serpentinus]KAB3533174.1 peptidoglycan editing factor PgeF [Alkaliphilus serpentinus]